MIRFLGDLAGALFDVLKLAGYFLAGVLMVSGVIYAITGLINLLTFLFY